jgi:hypothetical protein
MKKIYQLFAFFITLLISSNLVAQCHSSGSTANGYVFQIDMTDSFGDGWNGNSLLICKNGSLFMIETVPSGSSASASFTLMIGETYSIHYDGAGSWGYENSFTLKVDGVLAYSSGTQSTGIPNDCVSGTAAAPATSYCAANSYMTNYSINIGNVSLNTMSNTSSGTQSTYNDQTSVSCPVTKGETYTLSVDALTNTYTVRYHAYIDWNDDGDFDDLAEAYDIGDGTSGAAKTIPVVVPFNASSSCRMRVICGYQPYRPPTFGAYCNSTAYGSYVTYYGQVEDYQLTVNDPPAPVADFTASTTNTSTGTSISFTDQSTNSPTSWSWDFGDGNTSTSQNPSHV